MTLQQGLAFGLVGLTIVAFIWGRFRYDLIACVALVAGLAVGVIPAESAFDGFRNDVTVIIACALIVSAAFSRSGIVEWALKPLTPLLKTNATQTPVLTAVVTLLSMCTKNVGALAIMMPVAMRVAAVTGTSPSRLLMPMAAGAMAGGMVTLVGTSPNIIVSEVRQQIEGQPFGMYDYAPVGLILTGLIVVLVSLTYRVLPERRKGGAALLGGVGDNVYLTEARVPEGWVLESRTVRQLTDLGEGGVNILALIRGGQRRAKPHGNAAVHAGDVLVLDGSQEALHRFLARARLELTRNNKPIATAPPTVEVISVEAVVGRHSSLRGKFVSEVDFYGDYGINVLGVSRTGYELVHRFHRLKLGPGDILLLQGAEDAMPPAVQGLDLLPLVERDVQLGTVRKRFMPAIVLALAMILVGLGLVHVAVAFFAAAVVTVALGGLRMRDAYAALDGPLLVLVAAMIPISNAIQETGGSALIGEFLSNLFVGLPGVLAVAGVLLASMIVTPFLNNAATVLIVAPIGATMAMQLGFGPDPFLMAVAVGAACDFLTPVGHQCNTLVMRPGGYRFEDYARLGAPLSLMVVLVAPPLILTFWPL
ncbi:MAG TPA: SLC13 family permease [Brevundimonas sp.]|uniref:SLC13 family permease n=1 Tax=Brevundimonas sp. TaxID=1871086 RepID=UPI002BD1D1B6|nr:SLC13 family permease [Brevundimonas sp.]HRH21004.1 SLC13 family permease [Brevundimonas sp.]